MGVKDYFKNKKKPASGRPGRTPNCCPYCGLGRGQDPTTLRPICGCVACGWRWFPEVVDGKVVEPRRCPRCFTRNWEVK